jgi:hypothetical protein
MVLNLRPRRSFSEKVTNAIEKVTNAIEKYGTIGTKVFDV